MAELTEDELLEMDDEAFEEMANNLDEKVENAEPVEEVIEDIVEPEVDEGLKIEEEEEEEVKESTEEVQDEINEETEEIEDTTEVNETDDNTQADIETEEDTIDEESQESDTETVNYETNFKELMKPVKVSGKEVQVKSIEDARNLISMGIDYSRKMRDVKPLRAVGETLKRARIIAEDGTVDEAKLLRLVDIDNGDSNALAELMQEKGIDPLDIETGKVSYTPQTSMVSEQSLAIEDVEKELVARGTVDNIISELDKLDVKSKQFFNESPSNLLKLDDDIKSGTYEKIMGAVQYERTLGRLGDMSDMEAYIQLASQNTPPSPPAVEPTEPTVKPSVAKRKAAGITKRAPVKKSVQPKYDFANMSDDEFEAQYMKEVY